MRAFIAASSLAMSVELAGSGAAAGRAGDTSGEAAGSCRAATFVGTSGCGGACAEHRRPRPTARLRTTIEGKSEAATSLRNKVLIGFLSLHPFRFEVTLHRMTAAQ